MKNVVITGGSRGIGRAAVEAFTRRGDRVYFFYCNSEEAAQSLSHATGAVAIRCDVSDGEQVKAAFAQIPDVDVLICNAGIWYGGLIDQITENQWDRLFNVNVKGIYHCVNAALPCFLHKHEGAIITVSSMWGQVGASCESVYSATKGAVIALTKSLAKELGPSGIRANVVAPGVIMTDMCAGYSESELEDLRQETPIGLLGKPEDVASAMCYLADEKFVTGQVLGINGGFVI